MSNPAIARVRDAIVATWFCLGAAPCFAEPTRYDGVDNHAYVTTDCKASWDGSHGSNVRLLIVDGTACGANSAPWLGQFWSVYFVIDAQHPKAEAMKTLMDTFQNGLLKSNPGATNIDRKPDGVELRDGVPVHLGITSFLDPRGRNFIVVSFVDDSVPGRIYGTTVVLMISTADILARNPDLAHFKAELARVRSLAQALAESITIVSPSAPAAARTRYYGIDDHAYIATDCSASADTSPKEIDSDTVQSRGWTINGAWWLPSCAGDYARPKDMLPRTFTMLATYRIRLAAGISDSDRHSAERHALTAALISTRRTLPTLNGFAIKRMRLLDSTNAIDDLSRLGAVEIKSYTSTDPVSGLPVVTPDILFDEVTYDGDGGQQACDVVYVDGSAPYALYVTDLLIFNPQDTDPKFSPLNVTPADGPPGSTSWHLLNNLVIMNR